MSAIQHLGTFPHKTRRTRALRGVFSFIAAALVAVVGLGVLMTAQGKSWSLPGPDSSNYKDFDQITKANVSQLQVAWFYPYGAPSFSPIYVDGVLYSLGRNASSIVALDASTGKEIWIHEGLNGIQNKGMSYWQSEDGRDKRLIFWINSFMQEIDATTGKTIPTFGIDGIVDMRKGLLRAEGTSLGASTGSPGRIWKNTLVVGGASGEAYVSPPGDIRAYDVITGKLVWQFHTVPQPGEYGYDTNPPQGWKYIGGANNWGELTLDEERGIVYIPTGSATYDFYGADRHGQNLFANSLLALDCRTGKRLWHFQTIHHDLWDLDEVSAPVLVTVMHDGKKVDVVAHAGKNGFLFVFNRVTGEPLWPIEERNVPQSDVPGELSWPTQPFATKPPAFVRQSFSVDDVNPWLAPSPQALEAFKQRVAKAKNGTGPQGGLYIPPGIGVDAVSMPGNQGGSNWGTTAAYPQKGLVFVVGVNQVALLQLFDVKKRAEAGRGVASGEVLTQGVAGYKQYCQSCHGADLRGAAPGTPSILNASDRLDDDAIRSVVNTSAGHQPTLATMPQADLTAVIAYVSYANPTGRRGGGPGARGGMSDPLPPGPVVARGGAPRPPLPPRYGGPFYPGVGGNAGSMAYPLDVDDTPPTRYMSDYGVLATWTRAPYTTLTAYDLNTGTIKWQVPTGDDPRTVAAGGPRGTGGIGARNGMVVTKSGLVFHASNDGKVRAFDQDNGRVLWTGTIAGQSLGIPEMYTVNGRQFLVVMSPRAGTGGAGGAGGQAPPASPDQPHGYIAFALPQSAAAKE